MNCFYALKYLAHSFFHLSLYSLMSPFVNFKFPSFSISSNFPHGKICFIPFRFRFWIINYKSHLCDHAIFGFSIQFYLFPLLNWIIIIIICIYLFSLLEIFSVQLAFSIDISSYCLKNIKESDSATVVFK